MEKDIAALGELLAMGFIHREEYERRVADIQSNPLMSLSSSSYGLYESRDTNMGYENLSSVTSALEDRSAGVLLSASQELYEYDSKPSEASISAALSACTKDEKGSSITSLYLCVVALLLTTYNSHSFVRVFDLQRYDGRERPPHQGWLVMTQE